MPKTKKCSCGCQKFVNIDCRPMFGDSSLSVTDGEKTTEVELCDDMGELVEDTEVPPEVEEFVHVSWSGMSVEVSLTICTSCRKVQ